MIDQSPPGDRGPILQHSPGFPDWLAAQDCSLALTEITRDEGLWQLVYC